MKINKLKMLTPVFFAILFVFNLIGCSSTPEGNPMDLMESYMKNIKSGRFDLAYDLLTQHEKENFGKGDFILLQQLIRDTTTLIDYRIVKDKEHKNAIINTKEYKEAVSFQINSTVKNLYLNKETSITSTGVIVNDGGVWRVNVESEKNINEAISDYYVQIGWMYVDGKGKDKELSKAANAFNEAVKRNPANGAAYYGLGSAYYYLNNFEESISTVNRGLDKITDSINKSNAYTVLGYSYISTNKVAEAKEAFKKALEFNPENTHAKSGFERLNK
ncbi:MAG: tetratricopeptide repeat protein [Clostridia bacterium]|nr:tetratricopeptide repeat protein [Clostridia bacterium]